MLGAFPKIAFNALQILQTVVKVREVVVGGEDFQITFAVFVVKSANKFGDDGFLPVDVSFFLPDLQSESLNLQLQRVNFFLRGLNVEFRLLGSVVEDCDLVLKGYLF